MLMDLDLQGRRVLVTAGTKGIGKAVVHLLKQQGATVLTTARHEPAESAADAFVAADLTTIQGCHLVVDAVQKHLGGVDIIIHVAGGSTAPGGGFAALGEEEWQQELNLTSVACGTLRSRVVAWDAGATGWGDHPRHLYSA